jgi:hypothetical protein
MLFVENVGIRWLRLETHITHMTHVVLVHVLQLEKMPWRVQFMIGFLSLLRNASTYGFPIAYHVLTRWSCGVCDEGSIYTCYRIL